MVKLDNLFQFTCVMCIVRMRRANWYYLVTSPVGRELPVRMRQGWSEIQNQHVELTEDSLENHRIVKLFVSLVNSVTKFGHYCIFSKKMMMNKNFFCDKTTDGLT